MPINKLDNPYKTGIYEQLLKLFTFCLCFIVGPVLGTWITSLTNDLLGAESAIAPPWVHYYLYIFVRAEWIAFVFGMRLHNRIITRAISIGPLNTKVYGASVLWPLLLTCLVVSSLSLAFRYGFADYPYYLAPHGMQLIVWLAWQSIYNSLVRYVPDSPTTKEIERSFHNDGV